MASVGNGNEETVSLNIMPMLDIFSILILFLLMNFSTDPVSHDLNEGIELPESATIRSLDEIPALIVSQQAISVNEKKVVDLVGGKVSPKDLSQGGIHPLYIELDKLSEANKKLLKAKEKASGKKESAPAITLEMDKRHDFKLLKQVMLSAEQADFVRFKLMVSKEIN